jgi:hypothetical protein
MSNKLRSVNTKFWDDPFIVELFPTEKLLFLYLITNPLTNLVGIYEISLRRISFDTGLNNESIENGLKRLETVRKAFFIDNFIILPNWLKNQNLNANMKKAVEREFSDLPKSLKDKILVNDTKGFETIRNGLSMIRKIEIETEDEIEEEIEKETELEISTEKNILFLDADESTFDEETKKYYLIAHSFWTLIRENLIELNISTSSMEKTKLNVWLDPIRLLIEKDNRKIEEFREVFEFLKHDDFWKEQIRSTAKLRKKNKDDITYFELLLMKSRNGEKRKRNSTDRKSNVSESYKRDILRRLHGTEGSENMQEN